MPKLQNGKFRHVHLSTIISALFLLDLHFVGDVARKTFDTPKKRKGEQHKQDDVTKIKKSSICKMKHSTRTHFNLLCRSGSSESSGEQNKQFHWCQSCASYSVSFLKPEETSQINRLTKLIHFQTLRIAVEFVARLLRNLQYITSTGKICRYISQRNETSEKFRWRKEKCASEYFDKLTKDLFSFKGRD